MVLQEMLLKAAGPPPSQLKTWQNSSQIISSAGWVWALMQIWLVIVPDGQKSAAS